VGGLRRVAVGRSHVGGRVRGCGAVRGERGGKQNLVSFISHKSRIFILNIYLWSI
jgi:hypothetical protein